MSSGQRAGLANWLEEDTRFLPAHHQAALLIELARSRGTRSHRLLRHTGVFLEDLCRGESWISPAQALRLIDNARQGARGHELSFLWGSRWFPGHYGPASTLLQHATSLREILDYLIRYQALLVPLLTPRLVEDERWCYLVWADSIGAGSLRPFLTEASMSAVVSLGNWLADARLPWRFAFRGRSPAHLEQYEVYFGEQLLFSAAVDVMAIEREWLYRTWRPASAMVSAVATSEADRELARLPASHGLLTVLYQYLFDNSHRPLTLERTAGHFGMSPATFKRKLKRHQTSFQKLLDEVRLHLSLYLIHVKGWRNEQVADYLNCQDPTNFRRAFKRWTGLTPAAYRSEILGG